MIFRELEGKPHGIVDLAEEGRKWLHAHPEIVAQHDINPLMFPAICQRMVQDLHDRMGIDWSYGGYLEDRSFLWKDSYLDNGKSAVHVGVDFNVPADTKVMTRNDAEVIRIDDDDDQEGGWGPRIIVRLVEHQGHALIYAHLSRDIRCKVGDILRAGQDFCAVGSPPHNGNWFPHLHVQAVERGHYEKLLGRNLVELDGYYALEEGREEVLRNFPEPVQLL